MKTQKPDRITVRLFAEDVRGWVRRANRGDAWLERFDGLEYRGGSKLLGGLKLEDLEPPGGLELEDLLDYGVVAGVVAFDGLVGDVALLEQVEHVGQHGVALSLGLGATFADVVLDALHQEVEVVEGVETAHHHAVEVLAQELAGVVVDAERQRAVHYGDFDLALDALQVPLLLREEVILVVAVEQLQVAFVDLPLGVFVDVGGLDAEHLQLTSNVHGAGGLACSWNSKEVHD